MADENPSILSYISIGTTDFARAVAPGVASTSALNAAMNVLLSICWSTLCDLSVAYKGVPL